eukprot:TRINITY_DN8012_c0_g1_i1.p2 TRINITY_DN8012_c0_g1~~TRINITY_DN8012_c0_g1_i1.p2  ORF type:complete len:189 (-),score=88.42 TRINITY_DN8012_c0_g1_i1:122-667(-)
MGKIRQSVKLLNSKLESKSASTAQSQEIQSRGKNKIKLGLSAPGVTKKTKLAEKKRKFVDRIESQIAEKKAAEESKSKKKSKSVQSQQKLNKQQKQQKSGGLETLSSLLPELLLMNTTGTVAPKPVAAKSITNKTRKKIMTNETKQLKAVLSLPAYKSSPFSILREHLQNKMEAEKAQKKK